jgi:hypothetical protein
VSWGSTAVAELMLSEPLEPPEGVEIPIIQFPKPMVQLMTHLLASFSVTCRAMLDLQGKLQEAKYAAADAAEQLNHHAAGVSELDAPGWVGSGLRVRVRGPRGVGSGLRKCGI